MNRPVAIAAGRMRELAEQGAARPLLPGRFPTPVELDGRWWHLPEDAVDEQFVLAPASVAAQLTRLDIRRGAGAAAVARYDGGGPA